MESLILHNGSRNGKSFPAADPLREREAVTAGAGAVVAAVATAAAASVEKIMTQCYCLCCGLGEGKKKKRGVSWRLRGLNISFLKHVFSGALSLV